jgi:polar amino acid transport system substrate-binding protein
MDMSAKPFGLTILAHAAGALLVVPALALYACGGLAAEPRVLVLNEENGAPFSNPERTGFFDVVATEAFRRAGLELRIVTMPAERALLLSESGASDGELNRNPAVEKSHPSLVRVPEKLGELRYAAFSKDGSIPGNLEALRGRPVGLIRGWKIFEQALAGRNDVIPANDPDQMFRLLQLGRIEVALYELRMGRAYIRAHALYDVSPLDPPLFIRDQFIYLYKGHAGQAPAIAAALRAMKKDGSYQRAYREGFLPQVGKRSQ